MIDKDFCMSSFLSFRFVADSNREWAKSWYQEPRWSCADKPQTNVRCADELTERLRQIVKEHIKGKKVGLLLSSGMDSAILAGMLPKGALAYTVNFEGGYDEASPAKEYANKFELNHKIMEINWSHYLNHSRYLMTETKAPLHPVMIPLYLMAKQAKLDKLDLVISGCSADSRFLGLDKLLSQDWPVEEFAKRYTFVDPNLVLNDPVSMLPIYEKFRGEDGNISLKKFILETQNCDCFYDAVEAADMTLLNPFEFVTLSENLWDENLKKLRNEKIGKPMIVEVFKKIYGYDPPLKQAFPRPMNRFLENWSGPKRKEFKKIDLSTLTGDQKYLIFSLEWFLKIIDGE
ncbi:asparagine synthase-related protein [Thermodesulfobacteriota bacterium]